MPFSPGVDDEPLVGLDPAPGGLGLVQALLNTSLPFSSDLLAEPASARRWLEASLSAWAAQTGQSQPSLRLGPHDLPRLRDLRHQVREWLAGPGGAAADGLALTVSLRTGGGSYQPAAGGADGVQALVGIELLLASHTGTLTRLKTCANPACGAAFFDRSRNSSRVWHDVRTCGNTANLRASRARRRTSTADADTAEPAPRD